MESALSHHNSNSTNDSNNSSSSTAILHFTLPSDLKITSSSSTAASNDGEQHQALQSMLLELLARQLLKAFSTCLSNRASSLAVSKRWSCLCLANLLLRLYYFRRLGDAKLCMHIINAIDSANPNDQSAPSTPSSPTSPSSSTEFPALSDFPKAESVTWCYLRGRIHLDAHDFVSAKKYLWQAFIWCHHQGIKAIHSIPSHSFTQYNSSINDHHQSVATSQSNSIFTYLVIAMLLVDGKLPNTRLLSHYSIDLDISNDSWKSDASNNNDIFKAKQYNQLNGSSSSIGKECLAILLQAVRTGNLGLIEGPLMESPIHRSWLLTSRLYPLVQTYIKQIVFCTLLRKTYLIALSNPLSTVSHSIQSSQSYPLSNQQSIPVISQGRIPIPLLVHLFAKLFPSNTINSSQTTNIPYTNTINIPLIEYDSWQLECILANLIGKGRIKGYLSHDKAVLVVSKKGDPFMVRSD